MRHVRRNGAEKADRTGTGTLSVFGYQMRFDLGGGLSAGDHQARALQVHRLRTAVVPARRDQHEIPARATASASGTSGPMRTASSGPVYGKQWRSWPARDGREIDQISQVVEQLRTNPDSRRIIVSAWNVGELDQMKLMPCHAFFQFYVSDKRLTCQLYQRSADIFLGVPFNIASYALLTHMLAQQCDLEVGEFIWTGGDCHLYSEPSQAGRRAVVARAARAAEADAGAPAADHFRLQVRGFPDRELSTPPGDQGAGGRMTTMSKKTKKKKSKAFDQSQPKRGGPPIADVAARRGAQFRSARPRRVRRRATSRRARAFSNISATAFRTPPRTSATKITTRTTITRSCSSSTRTR